MSRSKVMRTALSAMVIAGASCTGLAAQTPVKQDADAAFFKGRTVKIVVGYSPGGGYDIYAHMIAPFLEKYLKATVIVDNEPGAGGLRALDSLYVTPPDGLQIMLVKGNAASMAQLTHQSGVRYDLTKFGFLGGAGISPDIWVMSPTSNIKSVPDALKSKSVIRWAATGPMDGLSDGAAIVCHSLALNCKVIMGYTGTNDAALALGRGEMDAMITNEASASAYVRANNARAITAISRTRSRYFPALATIYEAEPLTPDQKWWFDFRTNSDILGRILLAPPGMAPSREKVLQNAIKEALTDPELIAQSEKSQHFIEYQTPASISAAAAKILNKTTSDEKEKVMTVVAKTN